MWKENKNYSQISRNFYHNSTTKKQLHLRSRFLGIEYQLQLLSCMPWHTAWEISKYGVISGPYFPEFGPITKLFSHSHKKQVNTDQEKSSYLDTFCAVWVFCNLKYLSLFQQSCMHMVSLKALNLWSYLKKIENRKYKETTLVLQKLLLLGFRKAQQTDRFYLIFHWPCTLSNRSYVE